MFDKDEVLPQAYLIRISQPSSSSLIIDSIHRDGGGAVLPSKWQYMVPFFSAPNIFLAGGPENPLGTPILPKIDSRSIGDGLKCVRGWEIPENWLGRCHPEDILGSEIPVSDKKSP